MDNSVGELVSCFNWSWITSADCTTTAGGVVVASSFEFCCVWDETRGIQRRWFLITAFLCRFATLCLLRIHRMCARDKKWTKSKWPEGLSVGWALPKEDWTLPRESFVWAETPNARKAVAALCWLARRRNCTNCSDDLHIIPYGRKYDKKWTNLIGSSSDFLRKDKNSIFITY